MRITLSITYFETMLRPITKPVTLTLKIEGDLFQTIKDDAEDQDKSQSEVVRKIIKKHYKYKDKKSS